MARTMILDQLVDTEIQNRPDSSQSMIFFFKIPASMGISLTGEVTLISLTEEVTVISLTGEVTLISLTGEVTLILLTGEVTLISQLRENSNSNGNKCYNNKKISNHH